MQSRFSQLLTLGVLLVTPARFATPKSAPAVAPCTVGGTMINGSTHQPIRKARVQMNSSLGAGFSQTSITAEDGSVLDGDGKPVANAGVEAVPDEAHRNRDEYYRSARSDSTGRFDILGLPPGDYTLYATDKDPYGSFQDPDFLRQIAGQGANVEIDEKQQRSLQLNLIQLR